MAEIRCPIYEAALISKHERAIVCGEKVILYYELDDLVSLVASRLQRGGCVAGTRVGLFLQQDWRYVVLLLGILRAGCVACPMNTRLPPAQALDLFRSIQVRTVIAVADAERRRALHDFHVHDPNELLVRTAGDTPLDWNKHVVLDRPATIIFTSGSSGAPKAALHSYANHYYSARGSNSNIRVGSHDRWLLSLPLYHVGGLGVVFRCLLGGAAIAVPEPGEPLSESLERMGVTHLSVVDTQLFRLLRDRKDADTLSGVKAILLGGGPVNPSLIRDALEKRIPVFASYGLTEMTSQVSTSLPETPPAQRYTSGKTLRYRQLKIGPGGEILVRGETLFRGYVDGAGVRIDVDEDGWFDTGDLGALDTDGYLTVTGRKDNMFISGGENIQPEEIERAILACDGVEACVVVSVADAEFGRRPVAFVKGTLDVRAELEKVLPRFKVPKDILPWPESVEDGLKPSRQNLANIAQDVLKAE